MLTMLLAPVLSTAYASKAQFNDFNAGFYESAQKYAMHSVFQGFDAFKKDASRSVEFAIKTTAVVADSVETGANRAYQFTTDYAIPAAKKGGEYTWKLAKVMEPITLKVASGSAYIALTAVKYAGQGVHESCEYLKTQLPSEERRANYSKKKQAAFYAVNIPLCGLSGLGYYTREASAWLRNYL